MLPADNWVAQLTIFLLGRFFATYAMNVGFQFTVEVMPTSVLYRAVLYRAVLYRYRAVLYCTTVLYCTVLYCTHCVMCFSSW